MMSRITLHLRRQGRTADMDQNAHVLATYGSANNLRSRLRFTRSAGRSTADFSQVSVSVQETSVIHDDNGHLVDEVDKNEYLYAIQQKKEAAVQEWYELRSPSPSHFAGRSKTSDGEVRFV